MLNFKSIIMAKKSIVKFDQISDMIIELRGMQVILDVDVASLYGEETRIINQAVKNNPEKFPPSYVFTTTDEDLKDIKNFDILEKIKYFKINPKAFTEKGLYMLATILKGKQAVDTTIAIIETFAKLRELGRTISKLSQPQDQETQQQLVEKSDNIISDIIGDDLKVSETESEFELNFAVVKLKHKVIRKKQ
jgi:hypothetical protein